MDDGAAHLLVDADHRAHRQIMATDVFGSIQPPQAELLRAPIHLVALGGGERNPFARGLAFHQGGFERDQFVAHEACNQILDHSVFLRNFEIQDASPLSVATCFDRQERSRSYAPSAGPLTAH